MIEKFVVEKTKLGYELTRVATDFYDCSNVEYELIKIFKSKVKADKVAKLLNEE